MAKYNTQQYNTGQYNAPATPQLATVPSPINPRAYLGTSQNAYVFMWTIDCCTDCSGGSPSPLNQYDFQLCIDTDPSFTSPNKRCFTNEDAVTGFGIGGFGEDGFGIGGFAGGVRGFVGFNKGQLVLAYEIAFPIRAEDQTIPYYWRVRVLSATLESPFTDIQTFTRDSSQKTDITNTIFANYPDENVYTKDVNSTNVFLFAQEYARQIEELEFETTRTIRDVALPTVRDESFYNNFGVLYNFPRKNQTLQEYREQLIQLRNAYQFSGTFEAIQTIVKIFTCQFPDITEIKDLIGWRIFTKTDPEPDRPHYYLQDPAYPALAPVIVIYSKADKAHAFILTVHNQFGVSLDQQYLKDLIVQLIPAYAKVEMVFA